MLRPQMAMVRKPDDEAIADLAHVPDGHPMASQARLLAGQVELRRRRLRFAEKYLLDAIRLDPMLVQPHRELVYIYGMQIRRRDLYNQFLALSGLAAMTFDN